MQVRTIAFAAIASSFMCAAGAQPSSTPSTANGAALNAVPVYAADYVIGPQDTLTIEVFGIPELGGTAQVDNAGFVAVPLLGQVRASGRTTGDLSHEIASELDKKYVKHPIVTVVVKDAASQKITVDGEVTQPGVYQITPQTTLTQAVAMAHGPDTVADIHHVAIVRHGVQGRSVSVFDLDDIHDGKQVDPPIRANDEVVVDASGSRQFVRDFSSAFSLIWLLKP
jgi:polysaccharide export outer membrane protein